MTFFLSMTLCLASLIGYFGFRTKVVSKYTKECIAFGSGAMIAIALGHIFPNAIEVSHDAAFAFLLGFLIIYLLENTSIVHPCVEHDCHYHHVSIWAFSWLFIHTMFDGVAVWAAAQNGLVVGGIVTLGILVHQIPVSLGLAGLAREWHLGTSQTRTLFLLFALSAPVGALIASHFAGIFESTSMAYILAFAGWSLLYVWASDLLPLVHKNSHKHIRLTALFTTGMMISVLAHFFE